MSLFVDYSARLVGNRPHEGRVEVYYNRQWGTVCDDNFGSSDANVVCRQLGYAGATQYHSSAYYGEGSGPIWLDDLECSGVEESLFDCSHIGIGNHNCRHGEDVGVVCQLPGIP